MLYVERVPGTNVTAHLVHFSSGAWSYSLWSDSDTDGECHVHSGSLPASLIHGLGFSLEPRQVAKVAFILHCE